ncbi:MAG: sugar phosphate isomerase/epimerase [Planctomycetes bacterium]|nr:sugar phosphate isomerase/epimerase [Planctomycetota bacterium]
MDLNRVSTCSYPLREQDAEHALKVVADAGFKKVDLWGRMPHFSADPSECDPDQRMAAASKYGVKIANLGTYPGGAFSSESEQEREDGLKEMFQTIDVAAKMGVRSIRVSPGKGEDGSVIDDIVPYFKKSAAHAEQRGVYLGMENHKGSIAGFPDLCLELCEKVGSKFFGALYEPCNLMHNEQDYKKAFGALKDYITHMHLKDGKWVNGKFERTMLGEGDIDVGWVVESLNGIGYEGDFALEYEICDKVPIENGLPKWLDYFMQF